MGKQTINEITIWLITAVIKDPFLFCEIRYLNHTTDFAPYHLTKRARGRNLNSVALPLWYYHCSSFLRFVVCPQMYMFPTYSTCFLCIVFQPALLLLQQRGAITAFSSRGLISWTIDYLVVKNESCFTQDPISPDRSVWEQSHSHSSLSLQTRPYGHRKAPLSLEETDKGVETNQLNGPRDLFVNDDDTVIVADWGNDCIVEWKRGATNGTVLAGGNGDGKRPDQLNRPTDVIFDKETDSLIVCERGNGRVARWPHRSGTRSGETIIPNISCFGLTMGNEGSLYVTDVEKHEVGRYRRQETSGILVAGGNGKGAALNQLNDPTYLSVDGEHAVYVSDYRNHRVTKWVKDAKEGTVVAGGRGRGTDLT